MTRAPSPPGLRTALLAATAQGWLLGAGGGTAVLLPVLWLGTGGGFAVDAFTILVVPVALVVALPVWVLGAVLVAVAPRLVLRWRMPLCLLCPVLVGAGIAAVEGDGRGRWVFTALAAADAAIAAGWCWRRASRLALRDDPAALARTFA